MEALHEQLIALLGEDRVKTHEPMADRTAFRAGGETALYVEVDKTDEIVELVKVCHKAQVPVKVIGSGTNMLIADAGFAGVIIKNNCRRFEIAGRTGKIQQRHVDFSSAMLYCESGAFVNQVVRYTIEEGLSGLEYQLGLPGTIGGGIYMNSLYPPQPSFMGDSLHSARIVTHTGEVLDVDNSYFQFGFDFSYLQKSGDILLHAVFQLQPFPKELLWDRGQEASNYRISEQPRGVGMGMTYRNLKVTEVAGSGYSLGKPGVDQVLRESGALILQSGNVKLYEKRYNYILNMGDGKVADMNNLVQAIKKQVKDISQVELHFESHVVGEE